MKPKKHFPGAGKFDIFNSTYRSKIVFTHTQRVPHLDGYSKGIYQQKEPDDKIQMLEKWIERLYHNEYFDPTRTKRIEFYEQKFLQDDELFLVLEPLSYSVKSDKYLLNERLNKFLVRLYKQIKEGKPDPKTLTDKRILIKEDEIFQLRTKRFYNTDQLTEFCIGKMKEGYEEAHVKHFFRRYRDKYLINSSQNQQKQA